MTGSLSRILDRLANSLFFFLLFISLFFFLACGILVPGLEMEPRPQADNESGTSNHWTARELPAAFVRTKTDRRGQGSS